MAKRGPQVHHPLFLFVCVASFLVSVSFGQAWDYSHREYVVDEIPLHAIIQASQSHGHYAHNNNMRLKSVVLPLGNCLKGHPCAISSGFSHLFPDGCPTSCSPRFADDPFQSYNQQCVEQITEENGDYLIQHFGNLTLLVAEWKEYRNVDCLLFYNSEADEWIHEAEGVAIVTTAQGFLFPAQTIVVSDLDSVAESEKAVWPRVMQEVSTNFALLNNELIRPTNSYAADHHSFIEVLLSAQLVSEINVTLSQALFDALDLNIEETWVQGTMSAMSSDKVDNLPNWRYPEFAKEVMGGVVWAKFDSAFDSKFFTALVQTMTLGNKRETDADQSVELYPIKVRKRCRCKSTSQIGLIVRPTEEFGLCSSHILTTVGYVCEEGGMFYCNLVKMTGWHRTEKAREDGRVSCEARNQTKVVYEVDVEGAGAN